MERCTFRAIVALVTLCACASTAEADNLLANPGFTEIDERGLPKRWELFVMPMEGAIGRLDTSTLGEPYAAMLHNPEAYPEEPANNWSQSVIADLAGKELLVAGDIRCEDATEAAIWLQCWAKNRLRVLAAATTSTDSPVYGTKGWTHVEMKITVPENTDFIILRCVLKGRGTAWFDDVRVEDSPITAETGDGKATPETEAQQTAEDKEPILKTGEDVGKALAALRETNEALVARIKALQDRLDALRPDPAPRASRLDPPTIPRPTRPRSETISPRAGLKVPTRPTMPRHPIVPHGYYDEKKKPK